MKGHCTCDFRLVERAFLIAGLIYCSDCDKPICCAAVYTDNSADPHAAEFAYEETFLCWQHWDSVANLELTHRKPDTLSA